MQFLNLCIILLTKLLITSYIIDNILNSPPILEAFDDLWLLENQTNPCNNQGLSGLAESLSIENGLLQEKYTSTYEYYQQDSSFATLVEASKIENMFAEQESNMFVEQENSIVINSNSTGKGFSSKTKERKSKRKNFETADNKGAVQSKVEEESFVKKQDHNAKERVRRMKLSESYLALGSSLPNSRPSKVLHHQFSFRN